MPLSKTDTDTSTINIHSNISNINNNNNSTSSIGDNAVGYENESGVLPSSSSLQPFLAQERENAIAMKELRCNKLHAVCLSGDAETLQLLIEEELAQNKKETTRETHHHCAKVSPLGNIILCSDFLSHQSQKSGEIFQLREFLNVPGCFSGLNYAVQYYSESDESESESDGGGGRNSSEKNENIFQKKNNTAFPLCKNCSNSSSGDNSRNNDSNDDDDDSNDDDDDDESLSSNAHLNASSKYDLLSTTIPISNKENSNNLQTLNTTNNNNNSNNVHNNNSNNNDNSCHSFAVFEKEIFLANMSSQNLFKRVYSFINTRDYCGNTPLHWAAFRGHDRCLQVLLGAGADPSITDNSGRLALHDAASRGYTRCLKLLLLAIQEKEKRKLQNMTKCANCQTEFSLKRTSSSSSSSSNSLKSSSPVSSSVSMDRLINLKDGFGLTPLHYASRNGDLSSVKLLLEYGSNPDSLAFNADFRY